MSVWKSGFLRMGLALALCHAGALAMAQAIVVDNDDGPPSFVAQGAWKLSGLTGYNDSTCLYVYDSDALSTATWTPDFPMAGRFEVYAIFRAGYNRTEGASYRIRHAGGEAVVRVTQQEGVSTDLVERYLGEYDFAPGRAGNVALPNTDYSGVYIADAIRFQPAVDDPPRIEWKGFEPGIPSPLEPAFALARITDDQDAVASATLHARFEPGGSRGEFPALDDGEHGDGAPGDGVFGALIPGMPGKEQVTAYFAAVDASDNRATSGERTYVIVDLARADAFLMAGQSNASGRAALDGNNETPHPRVLLFGNDYQYKQATEPIDSREGQVDTVSLDEQIIATSGHGFSLRAAKEVVERTTATVVIIPCPKGGTDISDWRRGADPFDRSTLFGSMNYRRSTAAPAGAKALWWYQGESDRGSATFPQDYAALLREFREEMGADLPVVYVQLARDMDSTRNSPIHRIAESQRLMETGSGSQWEQTRHFMVVAFDLPMRDSVHLDQAGQKELGRRIGLATLEHVYGRSGVDGTGPRLLAARPLVHPGGDKSKVLARFSRPVRETANDYDQLFRAFDSAGEITVTSARRDLDNESAVLLTLERAGVGEVTVSYGDRPVDEASLGEWLNGAVRGANESNLPAPRFGPLPVVSGEAGGVDGLVTY